MEHQTTILVVDDNEALRYALARALRSGGYNVLEAATGREALRLARMSPDLITLDINLPDTDGYEVCRQLRVSPDTKRIPILQISASFVAPEHKIKSLEVGADAYLAEPINRDELLATVNSLLRMKQAEEESRRRERELRFLADSIPQLVWITDASGRTTYFNSRWFAFVGVSEPEAMKDGWLQAVHRGDVDGIAALWNKSLQSGEPFQAQARFVNATGEYRWMLIQAVSMQSEDAVGAQWFCTSTDITDEKTREEILRRTERMALAGRLAASIAHEINNPLEAITNILYILESSQELSGNLKEFVRIGSTELKRISHIVRQSLSYYRNADKPVLVDISELLEETLNILDHHLVAHGVKAIRRYSAARMLNVFTSEIRQVLSNLILNAVESMPEGGRLIVKTSNSRDWRDPGLLGVRVTIADTGVGIPDTDRARIFEAFFTTKNEKGTGLGLWVTNDILTKHGGKIRVRSTTSPGRSGTVFSLFLPCDSEKETRMIDTNVREAKVADEK